MTRGELISAQVTSLLEHEKEVGREMIEVYTLTMPTEVWMGADYLVAPVFVLEEKQSWFLPASKQKEVQTKRFFTQPVVDLWNSFPKAYRSSRRRDRDMEERSCEDY